MQALSDTIIVTLREHPINVERRNLGLPYTNFLTLRGCGQRLQVPSFQDKWGLKPFMIAPTAIIRGVGITFGMPLIEVPGTTGYYDSDLNAKSKKAASLLLETDYNFAFVHVKATDDAGHDKSHKIKIEQFEKCDQMISTFIENVQDSNHEYVICITGDHTTPTLSGDHTYEPVPILISLVSNYLNRNEGNGLNGLKDNVAKFDEISCSYDSLLGRFNGIELIPTLLKCKDWINEQIKE